MKQTPQQLVNPKPIHSTPPTLHTINISRMNSQKKVITSIKSPPYIYSIRTSFIFYYSFLNCLFFLFSFHFSFSLFLRIVWLLIVHQHLHLLLFLFLLHFLFYKLGLPQVTLTLLLFSLHSWVRFTSLVFIFISRIFNFVCDIFILKFGYVRVVVIVYYITDNVCKEVECGKGNCKPSRNSTFLFDCECEAGWSQARSNHTHSFAFLPCVVPNCKSLFILSKFISQPFIRLSHTVLLFIYNAN